MIEISEQQSRSTCIQIEISVTNRMMLINYWQLDIYVATKRDRLIMNMPMILWGMNLDSSAKPIQSPAMKNQNSKLEEKERIKG